MPSRRDERAPLRPIFVKSQSLERERKRKRGRKEGRKEGGKEGARKEGTRILKY